MSASVLVVGAGFTGATVARVLAERDIDVVVVDSRPHVAGNCHTSRDDRTGVMVHVYGPHLFHTKHQQVWDFVTRFAEMLPYRHRVRAVVQGRVYLMPINLHTINQFFGTRMGPEEAKEFLRSKARSDVAEPRNFDEQGRSMMGDELFEAFFAGYTRKQWGRDTTALPASVLKRLPFRFDYDDSYFQDPFQGQPRDGFTALIENMLDHPRIDVRLGEAATPDGGAGSRHMVWTGGIDAFFGHDLGRLAYRTLDFKRIEVDVPDAQGCSVINECDVDVPFTRTSEHAHFSPWERHDRSVLFQEFSRECEAGDTPYYPVRLAEDQPLLDAYIERARHARGVSFLGRLGTYRYLDMDACIAEALAAGELLAQHLSAGTAPPVFFPGSPP